MPVSAAEKLCEQLYLKTGNRRLEVTHQSEKVRMSLADKVQEPSGNRIHSKSILQWSLSLLSYQFQEDHDYIPVQHRFVVRPSGCYRCLKEEI